MLKPIIVTRLWTTLGVLNFCNLLYDQYLMYFMHYLNDFQGPPSQINQDMMKKKCTVLCVTGLPSVTTFKYKSKFIVVKAILPHHTLCSVVFHNVISFCGCTSE